MNSNNFWFADLRTSKMKNYQYFKKRWFHAFHGSFAKNSTPQLCTVWKLRKYSKVISISSHYFYSVRDLNIFRAKLVDRLNNLLIELREFDCFKEILVFHNSQQKITLWLFVMKFSCHFDRIPLVVKIWTTKYEWILNSFKLHNPHLINDFWPSNMMPTCQKYLTIG